MSLDNNSANNFKDFLDAIKPYLNYQPVDLSCMGIDAFQFSTDEKPVGMATDRKLLYAKTIDCGALPNKTEKNVAHGISNLEKVYFCGGMATSSNYAYQITLPFVHGNDPVNSQVGLSVNQTNINLDGRKVNLSTSSIAFVTFFM